MLGLLTTGCTVIPKQHDDRLLAVRFVGNPLQKDEAISQLEITAYPASVYKIDHLPYDWDIYASFPLSFEVSCKMGSGHNSSSISDIHDLNDVIYLRVRADCMKDLKVTTQIWTTRGSAGDGRVVVLDSNQIQLH